MPTRVGRITPPPTAELRALGTAIDGDVVTRDAEAYEALRAPAVPQTDDVRPLAIVRCRTAEDVAATLTLARRLGVPVAPRSGGHCFAGRSSTAGIIVDVSPMHAVDLTDDLAIVGAGVRLGALYDALDRQGRTVPAGCGATVGIAGLILGGGIGVLGRRHEPVACEPVAAQVVLADGRIVTCDAQRHRDLFWALRGAGGGQFGVVTSLSLRTVPAPSSTTYHLHWKGSHAAAVIAAWQRWAPDTTDGVDATLRVIASSEPHRPPTVHLVGAIHEPRAEAEQLLEDLVSRSGADPHRTSIQHESFRDAKAWLAGRDDDPEDGAAIPVTTSELFDRDLPPALVTALLRHLSASGIRRRTRQMTLTPLGAAYNRVSPRATAFAHRRQRFMLEHSTSAPRADLPAARAWAHQAWATAHSVGTGRVYPNFPDPQLPGAASAYHGENLARLREIKRRYDPERAFRFHQSL